MFSVSLDHFGFVFSNLVFGFSFFPGPSQDIGLEEHLRNDLFCAEWHVKPFSVTYNVYRLFCGVWTRGFLR